MKKNKKSKVLRRKRKRRKANGYTNTKTDN